jgi:hypothetical protein
MFGAVKSFWNEAKTIPETENINLCHFFPVISFITMDQ